MKKWLFFVMITILSISFVIVPKENIGFFDIKNAISSPDDNKVELYITSWCPYCQKAMAFLRSRGVPFDVYDIEKDAEAARRKNEMDTKRGVPFAVIYGQKIHGFSEKKYQKALDARGVVQEKAKQDEPDKVRRGKSTKKAKSWQLLNR